MEAVMHVSQVDGRVIAPIKRVGLFVVLGGKEKKRNIDQLRSSRRSQNAPDEANLATKGTAEGISR